MRGHRSSGLAPLTSSHCSGPARTMRMSSYSGSIEPCAPPGSVISSASGDSGRVRSGGTTSDFTLSASR